MNRRNFLLSATGLFLPTPEPVRRYFFAPSGGWAVPPLDSVATRREWVMLANPVDLGALLLRCVPGAGESIRFDGQWWIPRGNVVVAPAGAAAFWADADKDWRPLSA